MVETTCLLDHVMHKNHHVAAVDKCFPVLKLTEGITLRPCAAVKRFSPHGGGGDEEQLPGCDLLVLPVCVDY